MTEHGDRQNGPAKFLKDWLRFNDRHPPPTRRFWALLGVIALFLAASALLAIATGSR